MKSHEVGCSNHHCRLRRLLSIPDPPVGTNGACRCIATEGALRLIQAAISEARAEARREALEEAIEEIAYEHDHHPLPSIRQGLGRAHKCVSALLTDHQPSQEANSDGE